MHLDFEKERERLAIQYAKNTDVEMEQLANIAFSLSEPAKAALRLDLARRNLQTTIREVPELPPVHDAPNIVIVRPFRDVPAALLAKSILDSAGIECFLTDINTIRMDWLYSNAIGGVKLLVREDDVNAANELLDQTPLSEFDVPDVGEFKQPQCPICGSLEVSYQGLQRNLAYGTVALGIPFPVSHVAWHCASCKHVWEDAEDSAPKETTPE